MNGLREGIVDGGQQHQKFHFLIQHLFLGCAEERAVLVDRMYDGPCQREEPDMIAFHSELRGDFFTRDTIGQTRAAPAGIPPFRSEL